jgi:hypothetical protein
MGDHITCIWCGEEIQMGNPYHFSDDATEVRNYFHPHCWVEYRRWFNEQEKRE